MSFFEKRKNLTEEEKRELEEKEYEKMRETRRKRKERKRKRKEVLLKFTESKKNELLKQYFDILEGKTPPRFQRMKENGELKKRIDKALKILEKCELCERKCQVNRTKGEKGFCGGSNKPEMFVSFPHNGDEDFLVPSYTVFFRGCNMKCQFCQNFQISQRIEDGPCQFCGKEGEEKKNCDLCNGLKNQTVQDIEELIDTNAKSCRTLQFIGGEPTPSLPFILQTLEEVESSIPTIWKSNFYFSEQSFHLLKGVVDIWLTDWKFGCNECAERLAKVPKYWDIVKRNHDLVVNDDDAVVIIRHLIMPNHLECCTKPILKYLSENYGKKVIVNLMDQYEPKWLAEKYEDIQGVPSRRELKKAYEFAQELNLVWICH